MSKQVVLGSNGQIGEGVARELKLGGYTSDIRVVSRRPAKVNDTDEVFPADLTDAAQALEAVRGCSIAYFTLGLPMDTAMWESQFVRILANVIAACKAHGAKLVFFDNTYMYPQDGRPLAEDTPFEPVGRKGAVRRTMAEMVLAEMAARAAEGGNTNGGAAKGLEALICRAPEFYGPAKTQSITNTLVLGPLKAGTKVKVPLRDDTLRSLIWTPDASRAAALLGNTPDAYGQTWHLPVDNKRLTYKQIIALATEIFGKPASYSVLPCWVLRVGSWFSTAASELQELLPRYQHDNIFVDSKFTARFPQFKVTTYREGIEAIRDEKPSN